LLVVVQVKVKKVLLLQMVKRSNMDVLWTTSRNTIIRKGN
jgi:hypothetical protein